MADSAEVNGSKPESISSGEKTEKSGQNDGSNLVSPEEPNDTVHDEYPHGMKLAMIVVALIVTMFIVSLNQTTLSISNSC